MKLYTQLIGTAAAIALGAGCANDTGYSDNFFKNNDHEQVRAVLDRQEINGAKEDATIYAAHFEGSKLNSLGQRKLEMIADGPVDRDIVVYLDLRADDAATAARRDAVTAYLVGGGFDASHVKIEAGSNPNVTSPAAGNLARYAKTESENSGGGASAGGNAPMK
jgi:hypothetical protein